MSKNTLLILLAVLTAGSALRLLHLKEVGVDHFDAGAYAVSAASVRDGEAQLFPKQHFLSPPVFFTLSGWLARGTGLPIDRALAWMSGLFGVLTVLLAFLLGRAFMNDRAGLFAAAFIALSDHHIVLSRMGLTDTAFCALFLLALGLHRAAHRRDSYKLAILAGIAVGVAWNTKYHGWLAGMIAALATLPDFLAAASAGRWRILGRHALATAVACALYLPWFLHISGEEGGYAALATEHRRFLSDAGRFLQHGYRHFESWRYFDGALSHIGLAVAFLVAGTGSTRLRLSIALALLSLSFLVTSAGVIVILALIAIATALKTGHWRSLSWPLAFAIVFYLLTPLYRPYNRLAIPLILASALLAPAGLSWLEGLTTRYRRVQPGLLGLAAIFTALSFIAAPQPTVGVFGATSGFRHGSAAIVERLESEKPLGVVHVVGEPSLVHYLREAGIDARGIDLLEQIKARPAIAIVGIYALRTPQNREFLSANRDRVEELLSMAVPVGDIRLLDDFSPTDARAIRKSGGTPHMLTAYRLR